MSELIKTFYVPDLDCTIKMSTSNANLSGSLPEPHFKHYKWNFYIADFNEMSGWQLNMIHNTWYHFKLIGDNICWCYAINDTSKDRSYQLYNQNDQPIINEEYRKYINKLSDILLEQQ